MTRLKTFVELNRTINIIETVDNQILIEVLEYTLTGGCTLKLVTRYRAYNFDDVVQMYRDLKIAI